VDYISKRNSFESLLKPAIWTSHQHRRSQAPILFGKTCFYRVRGRHYKTRQCRCTLCQTLLYFLLNFVNWRGNISLRSRLCDTVWFISEIKVREESGGLKTYNAFSLRLSKEKKCLKKFTEKSSMTTLVKHISTGTKVIKRLLIHDSFSGLLSFHKFVLPEVTPEGGS
jgi:hypothetical protein